MYNHCLLTNDYRCEQYQRQLIHDSKKERLKLIHDSKKIRLKLKSGNHCVQGDVLVKSALTECSKEAKVDNCFVVNIQLK